MSYRIAGGFADMTVSPLPTRDFPNPCLIIRGQQAVHLAIEP
jgi:hypothetical protein